jgi:hypothetical protein
MRLFHRRDAPPADALAQLGRDERLVSWADTEAGSVVLATPRGLWWPDDEAAAALRLIAWQHVSRATWRDGVLAVIEADVVDDLLMFDRRPVAVRLSVPRDLPPTVRKRVEANIVRSELEPVTGGAARVVARRVPGENGLRWWARLEPGTADTGQVRSALAARVASLRADWERERPDQEW